MHREDALIELSFLLRQATANVEAMIAARQKGELFEDIDGRVHLPVTDVCGICGILKTSGHLCETCGENV